MKLDQKAKNYAEALYNVSTKSESEIAVMESLVSICNAIRSNAEFRSFLLSKRITSEQKASATCLLYTSPSPRDVEESRMPSSA